MQKFIYSLILIVLVACGGSPETMWSKKAKYIEQLLDDGYTGRAMDVAVKHVKFSKKHFGEDGVKTVLAREQLADIYYIQQMFGRCYRIYTETYKVALKRHGAGDLKLLRYYQKLAKLSTYTFNLDKAVIYHKLTLKLQKDRLGPLSLDSIESRKKLVAIYRYKKEKEKFYNELDIIFEILENEYGEHSPASEIYVKELLVLSRVEENIDNEVLHTETLLKIAQKEKGVTSSKAIQISMTLARLYIQNHDFKKAENILAKTLKINIGADSVALVKTYSLLGGVYTQLEEYEKAEKTLLKAKKIIYSNMKLNKDELSEVLEKIVILYQQSKQLAKSNAILEEVITYKKKRLGEYHPSLGSYIFMKRESLIQQNKEHEVAKMVPSLILFLKANDGPIVIINEQYKYLINYLSDQEKYKDALDLSLQEIAYMKSKLGNSERGFGPFYNKVATLYSKLGNIQKVKEFRAKAIVAYKIKKATP